MLSWRSSGGQKQKQCMEVLLSCGSQVSLRFLVHALDGTRPSLNYFLTGFTACSSVLHLVVVTSQQRFVGCMYFVIHPRHISIAACMGMACWPLFPAPLPEAVWMCIHSSRGGAVTLAVCSYACNNATVGLAHSCFCAQSPADTVYRG